MNPHEVNSQGMFLLAIVGIAVNGFAALRMKGSKKILDRTVVLHLLEDLLGWAAVLLVSIVIFFTNWYILDPILSIFIAFVVFQILRIKEEEAVLNINKQYETYAATVKWRIIPGLW